MDSQSGSDKRLSVSETILQDIRKSGILSSENIACCQNVKDLFEHLKTVETQLDEEINKFDSDQNLKEHLEELHNYNVVKDATQSLLGSISMQTGRSVTEVHKQFSV